jgi:beta-phosphoglucomutase-like phosphatase (HAD superfamily)
MVGARVPTDATTLLLDADGNLFPSEEPAFAASTEVVNRLMAEVGSPVRYEPEPLRRAAVGRSFRALAADLTAEAGRPLDDAALERWVAEERRAVSAHLAATLRPDAEVTGALERLGGRMALAAVSSSALSRLDACFRVTGLAELLPPPRRFSAEDSLPRPTSKPDPAVYRHALEALGVEAGAALAVEDSPTGARSAVGAGIPTVGNLRFVPGAERARREDELRAAGVVAVVGSWGELEDLLA